jgi:hypothetical protein
MKVLKEKYREVMIEKCCRGQKLLSFFYCKQVSEWHVIFKQIVSIL